MDGILEELNSEYPCRSAQIEELYNLFSNEEDPYPNAVYVYGGPSTGKTSIITSLLSKLKVKYAYINLFECYTSKILFEKILNNIAHHADNSAELPHAKCDNLMEFLNNLNKYSSHIDLNRWVFVMDKAEQLRNMDFNLLPSFLRLPELSGFSVSVILVSEIVFQKYYAKLNVVEPIKVYLPQYNKDQLLDILASDSNDHGLELVSNYDEFYRNYLNVFLSVFYRACRDLSELKYMAKLNFPKYCEPVLRMEKKANDSIGLWRHIAPILKSSLEVLYLRISTIDEENCYESSSNKSAITQPQKQSTFSKEKLAQSLELPFYAKYLLIAAYLASYNPAKEDKRLFVKYHGKKRKTMNDVKSKSKTSEELSTQLGPKSFNFDRLLAIFYAILDEKVSFNNNLLVQVSSLVELQLLSSHSDNYNLEAQKYKCNVDFDFIQTVAKMVGFSIRKYLVDFSHI